MSRAHRTRTPPGPARLQRDSEAAIHHRLANDPWHDRLRITRIEPWNIVVGAERLSTTETAATTL
jgi:hypothetical protein